MTNTFDLSSALEDYLEVILELDEKKEEIRVTDIAKRLNIAKSTATITVNKLKKLGLVIQESYGPVELTRAGKEYAEEVRGRHLLLHKFLIELGVDYKTAEKDACLMEHILSPVTMKRIAEFVNQENGIEQEHTTKTHRYRDAGSGITIGTADDEMGLRSTGVKSLNELRVGEKGNIIRIAGKGAIHRRILDMGAATGSEVVVKGIAPLGDPIEVTLKGYNLSFRKEEAKQIFVEVCRK